MRVRAAIVLCCATAGLCAFLDGPANAQEGSASLGYEIGVVSDYRYRGYSLSDEKPALQGGVTATFAQGMSVGAWGSSIAEYGVGADGDGARVEVDLTVGRAWSQAGFDLNLGLVAYVYSDGSDVNYLEVPVSIARTMGDWTFTVGGAYAPDQHALARNNAYIYGSAAWALTDTPWTLSAAVGHERGAFAPFGKWDWQVGVERAFGPISAGLTYVDSDEPGQDGALFASIRADL